MNNRIREVREQRGISQRKLALVLDLSPGAICRYENPDDKTGPSTEIWVKMSNYFGVPVDYLMGLSNSSHEKTAAPEGDGLSDGARRLIERYENASEEDRRRILAVVDAVVGEK